MADEFRRLCAGRGVPEETVAEQWLLLTHFRRYTFCKSHAVSYALLAWQCVAAKARSPLQFWTAVLNNNQGVYPRRVYVEAVKRAGFRVLLPCVNRSAEAFLPEGDGVRTGLGAIAALPREVRRRVLDERRKDGPYRGLADFCRRVAPGPEALAALIRCGGFGFHRTQPAHAVPRSGSAGPARGPDGISGDDAGASQWAPEDYDAGRRRADEQQLLGFVADAPMLSLFRPLLPPDAVRSVDLPRHKGRRVRVAGLVAAGRFVYTGKGLQVQFITLEDEWGLMETTIFPRTCRLVRGLTPGPYVAAGVVEEQFGVFSLTAERFTPVASPQGVLTRARTTAPLPPAPVDGRHRRPVDGRSDSSIVERRPADGPRASPSLESYFRGQAHHVYDALRQVPTLKIGARSISDLLSALNDFRENHGRRLNASCGSG